MSSKPESQNVSNIFLGGLQPPQPPATSSLEMLFLERAKALHSTPSLSSPTFPGFPGLRSGLFPRPLPTNLESLTNRWRQSLPANIQEDSSETQSHLSPPSPPPESPGSKKEDRAQTPDRPPSSTASSVVNGGSKPASEAGTLSPRATDSTSPLKCEESALRELTFPPPYSSPALPPLLSSSRIPKSDPMEARLQEMLRYNMEKSAGQALDTLGDSRRVRELLSVHNIGQRLFAKYVLGLSQGTVSELLSKPKSWDKLTEKGRDSYRKMHAWVWDDQAILLLKTLIPRKGELLRSSNSSMKQGKSLQSHCSVSHLLHYLAPLPEEREERHHSSEHRINKILSEVNKSSVIPEQHPHPGLLLPNNTDELKLAALSFYQNELSQLQKIPSGIHGDQSEEDHGQVSRNIQREGNISFKIIFRMSPRTATRTQ